MSQNAERLHDEVFLGIIPRKRLGHFDAQSNPMSGLSRPRRMRGVQIRDDDPRTGIDESNNTTARPKPRAPPVTTAIAPSIRGHSGTSYIVVVIRIAKKSSVRQPNLEPFAVT
jgi:hypothetical protein